VVGEGEGGLDQEDAGLHHRQVADILTLQWPLHAQDPWVEVLSRAMRAPHQEVV